MPTLEELVLVVQDTLQEEDISTDFIVRRLNEGLEYCARDVRLPNLESYGTFITTLGSYYTDIPADWNYGRSLYSAELDSDTLIEIASSVSQIKHASIINTVEQGQIEYLTVVGNKLFYYPSPSTQTTVLCRFYKKPETLVSDTDQVVSLPESFASSILENYALWKCYKIIEDEQEGQRVNTRHYRAAFFDDLQLLDDHINEGQSRPAPIRYNSWI